MNNRIFAAAALLTVTGLATAGSTTLLSASYRMHSAMNMMDHMDAVDADADSMVSEAEFGAFRKRVTSDLFAAMDSNDDGMLSHDEMMAAMAGDVLDAGR